MARWEAQITKILSYIASGPEKTQRADHFGGFLEGIPSTVGTQPKLANQDPGSNRNGGVEMR